MVELMPLNWVWLKMLYISARKSTTRCSDFSGNLLENVMSQLFIQVGIFTRLPAPAFPKHSIDCPTPCCGVAPGVQLQGIGIITACQLNVWVKPGLLKELPLASTYGLERFPSTTARAPSAEPVKLGVPVDVLNPGLTTPSMP